MNNLLDSFDSISSKAWKQKIQVDLKGAEYKTLLWQTLEGITVKPFYHFDQDNSVLDIKSPNSWNIAQHVFIDDEKIANEIALNALKNGANTITFTANKIFNIEKLFLNLKKEKLNFKLNFLDIAFASDLLNTSKEITLQIDPIGQLMEDGNWFKNKEQDFNALKQLLKQNLDRKIISINNNLIQNSGGNSVQQIAYALAHANEYLHAFGSETVSQMSFEFATGYNYFFEIAKLRAFRYLWQKLQEEYGITAATEAQIISTPSKRNKTLYDYNVNMLRTTNESMSAILGGANSIHNLPYDAIYHKSNSFGERIARNQLIILKEESGFDNLNAVKGAYYIENITISLAEKALEIFKSIEKGNGFLQLLFNGTIQRKIKESAQKEQDLFDKGELTLIGTNVLENPLDRMKNDLELFPFIKQNPRKTLIAPIIPRRLAEKLEKTRLEKEK
jgi:methylmalonyl-CoA mutase